jgi:hypothetical protein
MAQNQRDALLARSISPAAVRIVGNYTVPETFGVYQVTGNLNWGRKYRFGNHPVRQRELVRDYGAAHLEALFESRFNAKAFARILNRQ